MSFVNILADVPTIEINSKLIPNLWAFITQLLAFLVLVFIVIKFGYKPVHNYIQKRKEFVDSNLDNAQKLNAEADLNNKQAEENLNNSRKQASDIILQGKKQAEEDKQRYQEELKQELALKREQAERDIQLEKKQAIEECKQEIVDIALQASSQLLEREVDKKDTRKMVDSFVDDISKDDKDSK